MNSSQRIERIKLLRKHAELMKQAGLKNRDDMTAYYSVLTEIEKIQRIEDGFQNIMVFAQNYFTGEPPHDLLKADTPSPEFHFELADHLRSSVLNPNMVKTAISAPRSHAKSTVVTNIFAIYNICYIDDIHEHYWVIISDKQDNARRFLDTIKSEIEDNQLLINDFGDLKGNTWNALEIVTKNNVKISAHGAGEALRGLRYGSYRPSIIMDDIESDQSCSTPEQINKMVDWFDRTVLPLGDPKKSKYVLIGTVIHYNSLLNQVMNNRPDWIAFKYKAIQQFPERMDLWNKWEEIYHSRLEGNNPMESSRIARERSIEFYNIHKEEMHKGAQVLWKERLDLLSLMEIRATKRLAFNSEYMNDPIDEATRVFHKIWYYEPEDVRLDELDIYGSCDPSLGQSKRSDPSVILTVGRHKKTGIIYVLDVDVKRRHPDHIIQDIFKKAQIYNYQKFTIETIAFQQFMKDELIKRSAEQNVYIPVGEYKSNIKKEVRIASLEPLLTNGYVRILATQKDLIEQLEYFPKAAHDDAVDALAQVMDIAKKNVAGLSFGKI